MSETLDAQVYELIRLIPKGKVTTYKEIARKLGIKSFRQIGRIVGNNPDIPNTPCHRVVGTSGHLTGYKLGLAEKIKILESEGVFCESNIIVDFNDHFFEF